MRGVRSTGVLLAVFVGVMAYISYFVESGPPSSDADAREKVFALEADAIVELQIRADSGETTTLEKADGAWHRRTGIYPISHLLVVKDATLASHPGLATELFHLFNEARSQYLPRLRSGAADGAADRSLRKMAQTVGGDPLPYGFESSRRTLETFIRFNVDQRVIPHTVAPEDLFVPETLALV